MLQKVDLKQVQAKVEYSSVVNKESQTLDFIRKMKKEKALKIIKAYRLYKLRKLLKKRHAARKVKSKCSLIMFGILDLESL